MAKRKVRSASEEDVMVDVQEVEVGSASSSSAAVGGNQRLLLYLLGGAMLLALGWFAYKEFVVAPSNKEAMSTSWQAQQQFERDSFRLALDNPGGGNDGFLAIIDKYGSSAAGNSAKYYAGICYLNLGEFDNAIKHLDDFSPEGDLLPIMKYGALGDAYSEKQDFGKAMSMYEKAIGSGKNELLVPYYIKKAGMLSEFQGNKEAALKFYQRIKTDFPTSPVAADIDKYIAKNGGEE